MINIKTSWRSQYKNKIVDKREYDAVVVGSGPNGLAAAITMQLKGLSVLLIEAKDSIGGGMRSAELTLPGFIHDICSAIHPLAAISPFFKTLPLEKYGLQFVYPGLTAAHPFEDGGAAVLHGSVQQTALAFGIDKSAYMGLTNPLVEKWPFIANDLLGPLHFPKHPADMAAFGLKAIPSALRIARKFHTRELRGLWAGMAAHGMQPLSNSTTAATALVLLITAHINGWPVAKGGSGEMAKALANFFLALGGKIETNFYIRSLDQLPSSHAVLFDVTPKQLLQIAGHTFSSLYKWQLEKYRYGMGVFKIDWALDAPIPFTAAACRQAGTVHLGNTLEEIATAEQLTAKGTQPDRPFVLLAQQSLFDATRAPAGKHTAWGYCHTPNGSLEDLTEKIEQQVERFAPGFRERILARHTMNTAQLEQYNPNYTGGDINGGIMDIRQLFTRPALRLSPYKTSAKGIYICSASTPPGGGVHGMCGYYAAKKALKEIFKLEAPPLYDQDKIH